MKPLGWLWIGVAALPHFAASRVVRLLDDVTGQPAAGVNGMLAEAGRPGLRLVSDSRGELKLSEGVCALACGFSVEDERFAPAPVEITAETSEVRLSRERALRGRIESAPAEAVLSLHAMDALPGDKPLESMKLRAGGRFRFEQARRAGRYLLELRGEGAGAALRASVEHQPGAQNPLRLTAPGMTSVPLRLHNPDGAPAAGVTCRARIRESELARWRFVHHPWQLVPNEADARSGADGVAQLPALPVDLAVEWVVLAEGFAPRFITMAAAAAGPVTLDAGTTMATRVIDLTDRRPLRAARVGIALALPETEWRFAGPRWLPAEPVPLPAAKDAPEPPATHQFAHFPATGGRVVAEAPDHAPELVDAAPSREPRAPLEIRLARAGRLRGRVVDGHGKPLAGAEISFGDPGREWAIGRGVTTSAEDGRFASDPSTLSEMSVRVEKDGYLPGEFPSLRVGGAEHPITLALAPAVRGRVVDDENGEPVRRLHFMFEPADVMEYGEPIVAENGEFSFSAADEQVERLVIASPGYMPREIPVKLRPGTRVDLGEIRLARGLALRVKVVNDATGMPVPDAEVNAAAVNGRSFGFGGQQTDADGIYRLTGLASGELRVSAHHPQFQSASLTVKLPSVEQIELRLRAGRKLTLQLSNPDGSPCSGAIFLQSSEGRTIGIGQMLKETDPGRYERDGLAPGQFRYWVSCAGITHSFEADLREGSRDLALTLAGVSLDLHAAVGVSLGAGEGIELSPDLPENARNFHYFSAEGEELGFTRRRPVAPDGWYHFDYLQPGVHRLHIACGSDAVIVGERAVNRAEARLYGGAISGTLLRPDGRPAAGQRVLLVIPGGNSVAALCFTATDEAGRYQFNLVPDGDYRLGSERGPITTEPVLIPMRGGAPIELPPITLVP